MLLYGADADVCRFVSLEFFGNTEKFKNCPAIGVVSENRLICGVVYGDYCVDAQGSPLSMQMSIASTDRRWCTKKNINAFFSYPFIQLRLKRVWTQCSINERDTIMFNKRLGFKPEGIHKKAWPMGGDAVSFGMLKEGCKWIGGNDGR